MSTIAADTPVRAASQWSYVWIAGLCCAVMIGGFWPTYWGPLAAGSFVEGAPVLHIHGLIATAWPLLFLTQAWLAATGRTEWHRSLGLFGVALASAMVFTGLWVTAYSINVQSAAGDPFQARAFSIASVAKLAFFATCVAIAVANVMRPEIHKRLIVLATVALTQPAFGRLLFAFFAPSGSPQRPGLGEPPPLHLVGVPTSIMTDLILLAIIVYDWRTQGRLHPVYAIGGAALVAVQIFRVPLSTTPEWHAVADWLVMLGG
jgi:hypothetical protein